jgi:hypothetical protein
MYSTIPIYWNIKAAPASPGRSLVGPAFYVFSFLGQNIYFWRENERSAGRNLKTNAEKMFSLGAV